MLDLGYFLDSSIGGITNKAFSTVNVHDHYGNLLPADIVAQSSIHEILHTVRLGHPFEITQSEDTKLIRTGPNSFETTDKTDSNIVNNIMNYGSITIDGKRGDNMVFLTPGQLSFIRKEIYMQSQGYGFMKGIPVNYNTINEYDENYWMDFPGTAVN